MIFDTSALIAVLRNEEDAPRFARLLATRGQPTRLSSASWLEAAVVIDGARDAIASRRFDDLVARAGLVVEPVRPEQATTARATYRDFGKGCGHLAGLNFGDCFAYALAKSFDEPLVFMGDDFSETDVRTAKADV